MKKLLAFFIPFVFLFACEEETIPRNFDFNTEMVFKIDQRYHSPDNNLEIKITNIEDSRCPSDAVCVWQGEAKIYVTLEQSQTHSGILSTYDNQTDTLGNYSIELISVQPYPVSDEVIETEDYDVTLKVKSVF